MDWYITFIGKLGIPLMFLSFVLYCVFQVVAIQNLKGGWRIAAFIPLVFGILILVSTIIGGIQGASLFPIVMLLTGPPLLAYIALVYSLFKIASYRTNGSSHP